VPQGLELVRRRQRVAPDGELLDTSAAIVLESCPLDQFETEARSVGLLPAGRRDIPETPDHVGSVVVLLEGAR
jgi:hypothetical protein